MRPASYSWRDKPATLATGRFRVIVRKLSIALAVAALLGALLPGGPAFAGTQSFTGVLNPGALGAALPVTGAPVAVANDGTIFVGTTTGVRVSSDGGVSFGAAGALPFGFPPAAIAPSPNFGVDRIVFVVGTAATFPRLVVSFDGGATWSVAASGAPFDQATSVAVAPNFSTTSGGLVAVGVNPSNATSSIWIVTITAAQMSAATIGGLFFSALPGTVVNSAAANGALAVAFSPNFASDNIVLGVVADTGGAGPLVGGTQEVAGLVSLGIFSGGVTLIHAGNATGARIAFPAGFTTASFNYFVATSGVAASSVFRKVVGVWVDAFPGGGPKASIAVSGPFSSAVVFVGDASPIPGTAYSQVFRSNNGGASWLPQAFIGGSTGAANVVLSPNFPTDNTVYATTTGLQGGFWFSTSGGSNNAWAARGLHTDAYTTITAIAAHPTTANPLFAILGGPGTGDDAVFRTTSGPVASAVWSKTGFISGVDVAAIGLSRNFASDNTVYIGGGAQIAKSTNGGASFNPPSVSLVPSGTVNPAGIAVADANTVFVAAGGTIHKTTDSGGNWTLVALAGSPNIRQIALSPNHANDGTVLLAAVTPAGAAQVFLSTDAGASYNVLGVSPDPGPGVARNAVAFDSGYATNRAIYSGTGGNAARQNVYRWVVGTSTAWQTLSSGANNAGAAPTLAAGMNVSNLQAANGVLYAASSTTASTATSGVRRALNPTASYDGATASQWFDLGWAGLAGVGVSQAGTGKLDQEGAVGGGLASGAFTGAAASTLARNNAGMLVIPTSPTNNLVLVVDTTAAGATAPMTANIYAYTDVLLPAPTLVSPADASVLTATPTLSWSPYPALANAAFTVRYGTDPTFQDPANTSYTNVAPGTFSMGAPALPVFIAGRTYHWQVRAADSAGQNVPSPWSALRSYAAAGVVPGLLFPTSVAGSTLAVESLTPALTWQAAANATDYQVQVARDPTVVGTGGPYVTPVLNRTVGSGAPTLQLQPGDLQLNTVYFWQVRAAFGAINGPFTNLSAASGASGVFRTPTSGPLSILTAALPNGVVGTAYAQTLAAGGGTPPYTWSVIFGALPPGVTLTAATGALAGTPNSLGNFSFTVQVRDALAVTTARSFSIAVIMTPGMPVTRSLAPGWNTISAPFVLATPAFNAILPGCATAACANLITTAFAFQNGAWVQVTTDNQAALLGQPMTGLYVFIAGTGPVTATFTPSASPNPPPTKALAQGWNLVGPSALTGTQSYAQLLNGLPAPGGASPTATAMVDPNLGGGFSTSPTTDTVDQVKNGFAYWVFATGPVSLSGTVPTGVLSSQPAQAKA